VGEAAGTEDDQTPAGRTARAVQRLGHVLAAHDVDPTVLHRLASTLESLTEEAAASGPVRDKWLAIAARRGVLDPADAADPSTWPPPEPPGEGEAIEFDAWSFVGGPFNAFAMGARYWREGDGSRGRVTLGRAYEGPPGRVHGGAVAALFDEVMGATLRVLGTRAYTGRLAVDFVRAAPLDVLLDLRGWLVRREGRRLYLAGEAAVEGVAFARAEATFVEMAPAAAR
jgi:acyl-coenzyme A thioesterase PaaI-like protein